MPTNEVRIKNAILAAKEHAEELNSDAAWDRFAGKIAAAVIVEIKALTINYTAGLVAGAVPVTGVMTHTIS